MYKIENDIPIPKYTGSGSPTKKYPFYDMQVGESTYILGFPNLSPMFSRLRKKRGWVFTIRTDDTGTRVWRIK